jgi:hypothetical protein
VKEQAYDYMSKPFPPRQALEAAQRALSADHEPAIEVLSARPHWVELLIPCTREAAERIQTFLMKLDGGLPDDVRETIASCFRELLLNAVEWGGEFDPNRKVRIVSVRSPLMLMFRIADPGPAFRSRDSPMQRSINRNRNLPPYVHSRRARNSPRGIRNSDDKSQRRRTSV